MVHFPQRPGGGGDCADSDGEGVVPLDLNALGSVYVVAFSVCGKVLGVGRGSRLKILGILGQFQPFGFLP